MDELVGMRPSNLILEAETVRSLLSLFEVDMETLMRELCQLGKCWSHPVVSKFEVAAVGLDQHDRILFGVNLEFPPLPLFYSMLSALSPFLTKSRAW